MTAQKYFITISLIVFTSIAGKAQIVNGTCNALIGTFTTTLLPMPALNKICFNDAFSINSDQNFSVPDEIIGASNPTSPNYDPNAPIYDPGVVWLAYSCIPSVALTPIQAYTSGLTISDDPCLLTVVTATEDLNDFNDLSFINSFPEGTFTDNIVYYIPLTMYSIQTGTYNYCTLPALECYDFGDPIAVQYLPQISSTYTSNCTSGTATISLTGSSPLLNGDDFSGTAGSISPPSAIFINSTAPNNGNIVIGNLSASGPFSFNITDISGCSYNFLGNYDVDESDCITGEVLYWVPNTFTPDGDQFNQFFRPVLYSGYDPYEYDLLIFNRWGQLIWESDNSSIGWDGYYNDGRKCPDGVYTWKINLKTINNDKKIQVKGHVTLVR